MRVTKGQQGSEPVRWRCNSVGTRLAAYSIAIASVTGDDLRAAVAKLNAATAATGKVAASDAGTSR